LPEQRCGKIGNPNTLLVLSIAQCEIRDKACPGSLASILDVAAHPYAAFLEHLFSRSTGLADCVHSALIASMDFDALLRGLDLPGTNVLGGAILILLSFLANGQLNRMADRRTSKIRFVEDQLKSLYGPLYAITESNQAIYDKFSTGNAELIGGVATGRRLTDEESQAQDVWNSSVFQPSNRRMREIIETNAHLFTSKTIPQTVVEFLAHVENWEAILSGRSAEKECDVLEYVQFPLSFPDYVRTEYERVSKQHARLVGRHRSGR